MRVAELMNALKTAGVAPQYATDLALLSSTIDRVAAYSPWPELRSQFVIHHEPTVTPTPATFSGTAGERRIAIGGGGTFADVNLGMEFLQDENPIMAIGTISSGGTEYVLLDKPLQSDIAVGSSLTFFRREYVPLDERGFYLGQVRSDPSQSAASTFRRTPRRVVPNGYNAMERVVAQRTSEFVYELSRSVQSPAYAPAATIGAGAGTVVVAGTYRVYVAYRMGKFQSEPSPVYELVVPSGTPANNEGSITYTNPTGFALVFLVEGPLFTFECDQKYSRTGLREVQIPFPLDPNQLMALPLYRPTNGAMMVRYSGYPEERQNAVVTGWIHSQPVRSVYDETPFGSRFVSVFREALKHLETGDGKHLAAYQFALRNLRSSPRIL